MKKKTNVVGIVCGGGLASSCAQALGVINNVELVSEETKTKVFEYKNYRTGFDEFNNLAPVKQFIREQKKIGRNELCTCQSGKKYKNCCINK